MLPRRRIRWGCGALIDVGRFDVGYFQIIVTVPITLIDAKNDIGQDVYPTDKMHKFSASVTSYPDTTFYPINAYSYNEVAIFEGDIKRVAGEHGVSINSAATFVKV